MTGSIRDIDSPRGWVFWWSVVFALNLPLAIAGSWDLTDTDGRLGITAGVAWLWILGLWMFSRSSLGRRLILIGGAVTAVSQLVPIPHIVVGLCVAESSEFMSLARHDPRTEYRFTSIGALLATLATGLLLGVLSLLPGIMGMAFLRLVGWHNRGRPVEAWGIAWLDADQDGCLDPTDRSDEANNRGGVANRTENDESISRDLESRISNLQVDARTPC